MKFSFTRKLLGVYVVILTLLLIGKYVFNQINIEDMISNQISDLINNVINLE